MNCKAGDLAIVVSAPAAGTLVEVICAAQFGGGTLPDGYRYRPMERD